MAESIGTHWHPMAAYLYVLHLDGPALAWEYLRRNPEYRCDWLHRRGTNADALAQPWGLRVLEDPSCDGREAQPEWQPDPDGLVHLYPIEGPSDEVGSFDLWRLPGYKHLTHEGDRLVLTCDLAGRVLRGAVSTVLEDGMNYAYAVRADSRFRKRWQAVQRDIALWEATATESAAFTYGRPGREALLHLRALQALDGTLAGASHRAVAEALFGFSIVAECWAEDGDLRGQVRRLIRRGQTLMRGGYRRLLYTGTLGKGRSH